MRNKETAPVNNKSKEIKKENSGARLIIETLVSDEKILLAEERKSYHQPVKETATVETSAAPTFDALTKIRQQFANRQNSNEDAAKPLTDESLQLAWKRYTQQLKENKNSA